METTLVEVVTEELAVEDNVDEEAMLEELEVAESLEEVELEVLEVTEEVLDVEATEEVLELDVDTKQLTCESPDWTVPRVTSSTNTNAAPLREATLILRVVSASAGDVKEKVKSW